MIESLNIFVTGGAGSLGHAIARRRKKEGWDGRMTVYSTDAHKHELMRKSYPDIQFVQGDIRNEDTLYMAMVGHDVVIHAAAVKIIPVSEYQSIDTFDVNVIGSNIVCQTAIRASIAHVLAISTDKACHACNAYGASKYMMEKMVQEYSRAERDTIFHLVRYGNVLESNSSVLDAWKRAKVDGQPLKITDPTMTRFWLSPSMAVQYALIAFEQPSGWIFIPKQKALSIKKLAEYVVGSEVEMQPIPIRPGEKMHETLLTEEEGWYAEKGGNSFLLPPTTYPRTDFHLPPYSSDIAEEMTREELMQLLQEG